MKLWSEALHASVFPCSFKAFFVFPQCVKKGSSFLPQETRASNVSSPVPAFNYVTS